MILSALIGGEVDFTCLSDVVSMTFSLGFDVVLLVFFLLRLAGIMPMFRLTSCVASMIRWKWLRVCLRLIIFLTKRFSGTVESCKRILASSIRNLFVSLDVLGVNSGYECIKNF